MAVKISELSSSVSITSDDFFPIVDSGSATTKKATAQQILDFITGSSINNLNITVLTGSNVTGSTALFTSITSSYSGSGANLTNIPNTALVNNSLTIGSTTISLGASQTTIQGISVLTSSNITGSTALFTTTTASQSLITGDLRVIGTASISHLNTVGQTSLLIGDKYITILSGGVDHTGINGSGFLWGTSSGTGETTGALGEHAHILYDSSIDALEIFPGLYVTGSTTVFDISGTTAQFTTITASTMQIQGTTVFSGSMLIYGTASLSSNPSAAYLLYSSSLDKLVAFPGLYVSGNLTGSGHAKFDSLNISTTSVFSGSIFVSGSSIYGQVAELTSSTDSYTLLPQDSGKFLNVDSGSAVNVTVPAGLPAGFTISVCQLGSGSVSFVTGSGVTINNRQGHTKTAGQFAVASIVGTAADVYVLVGDTTT